MKHLQRIIVALTLLATAGYGGSSLAASGPEKPAAEGGVETFQSPTGGTVKLDPQHLKRRTLLVFAADFCPICRRETHRFVALAREKRGQIDVIGVVMDAEVGAAKHYVTTQHVDYPTIWDPEWRFAMRYRVKATPTLVLLATDGKIELVADGLTPELEKKL